jgi:hypothetical protein
MTVYKQLFSADEEGINKEALQAISFHNIFENNLDLLEKYPLNKYPILNLLILCDHLETWDRETGFESKYEDRNKIQRIELVDLKSEDNILYLTINYQMYRAFIPANESNTEKSLIDLITTKVKPVFDKMRLNSILKLDITFLLNYRTELFHWPITDA